MDSEYGMFSIETYCNYCGSDDVEIFIEDGRMFIRCNNCGGDDEIRLTGDAFELSRYNS